MRLAKANLVSTNDTANFVKKTDFDNKIKALSKNFTSNRNEFRNYQKNYQKKVKAIPTKGLIKDLINKFSILKGVKYFSSGIFQNYLVFMPTKKYIKCFSDTTQIDSWKSNGRSEESYCKYN